MAEFRVGAGYIRHNPGASYSARKYSKTEQNKTKEQKSAMMSNGYGSQLNVLPLAKAGTI